MPFKSQAQRRKFAQLLVEGKISNETFEEWNRETGSARLPDHVKPKARPRAKTRARARAKDLIARESMQSREKTQRAGAKAGRAAGDEGAAALPRLGDAHRRQRVQSGANRGTTDAELLRELALRNETVAGFQLAALN